MDSLVWIIQVGFKLAVPVMVATDDTEAVVLPFGGDDIIGGVALESDILVIGTEYGD
ncbi:hypothetical protein [Thalassobacillus sp. CUG 92003]|uniref:hypothetical protein n=1 Tax=Thalassobacillus sp. CUG 92003 TaxID=2736641 RepID=UPI0015E7171F|nr:hypothetical protein [Thalassobacillus sp. CUG 92003]